MVRRAMAMRGDGQVRALDRQRHGYVRRGHAHGAGALAPSDLVALQPRSTPEGGPPVPQHTHGFLGYHETAWTINRFAHIARKHGLVDVCLASLTKIYTLPNIEIQDAFFKLREQAKWCVPFGSKDARSRVRRADLGVLW